MIKLVVFGVLSLLGQNALAVDFNNSLVDAKFTSISSVEVRNDSTGSPALIVTGKGDLLIGETNRKNTGIELIYSGDEYSACADSANNAFTFLNLSTSGSPTWDISRDMATGEYGYMRETQTVQVIINQAKSNFIVNCEINSGR